MPDKVSVDEVAYMLEYIMENSGKVCRDYSICEHTECNIQYHIWAYADRLQKHLHMEPPKIIDISTRLRGIMQDNGNTIDHIHDEYCINCSPDKLP